MHYFPMQRVSTSLINNGCRTCRHRTPALAVAGTAVTRGFSCLNNIKVGIPSRHDVAWSGHDVAWACHDVAGSGHDVAWSCHDVAGSGHDVAWSGHDVA